MISIIRWLIVTGVTFYTSLLYKSTPLALLGYTELLLLALALLFLAYRMCTLYCQIQLPVSIAECGRPLTLRLCVENRSVLPCLKLKYRLVQGSHFLKKKKKKWICGRTVMPGENSYDYSLEFKNYGSYELQLEKVRIYDLTGLFYLHKTVKSCGIVQIFPKMQEVGVHLTEAARNFFGDADIYDDFRPGQDNSELFRVRPFQNGDKIQSVHWKLSAKMDELLVKEDSMPKACPVVFLLDYQTKTQKHERKVNVYLAVLASISFSMMDAGCPHYVAWYSNARKDVVRIRVEDEESLYIFLNCYLEETFPESAGNLQEAYEEKYRGERCLYTLLLDGSLELKKNREKIAEFAGKDWERKLDGLELVL